MGTRKETSTYTRNEQCIIECNLTYAVYKIGGRWKLPILSRLENDKLRFGQLKNEFSYISERMLTLQLKALEKDGLIKRTVYAEVPPKVEYELTEIALELTPIFKLLSEWGGRQRKL